MADQHFGIRFERTLNAQHKWVAMRILEGRPPDEDQPLLYIHERLDRGPGEDRCIITGLPIFDLESNPEEQISLTDLVQTVEFLKKQSS